MYLEFFRIPTFRYMTIRDYQTDCLLIQICPLKTNASLVYWLWYSPVIQKEVSSNFHTWNNFLIAVKPRNIPKYILNDLLRNVSFYITTGHLHSEVYLEKSANFYDSVLVSDQKTGQNVDCGSVDNVAGVDYRMPRRCGEGRYSVYSVYFCWTCRLLGV